MIFIIPLVFGALGAAVGAVAGAFTAHAFGEKDRQAAKHHKQVANELTSKYASFEKKYHEFTDESKRQIDDLTRQNALHEVEKDCLRLTVRLQQNLIFLMWEIEREPTADALKKFQAAVEQTNEVLQKLEEDLIVVPDDYYERLSTTAETKLINTVKPDKVNNILSIDLGRNYTKTCVSREPNSVVFIPANVKRMTLEEIYSGVFEPITDPLNFWMAHQGRGYAIGQLAADLGANLGIGQYKLEDALIKVLTCACYFKLRDEISVAISIPFFSQEQFQSDKTYLISMISGPHLINFRGESIYLDISKVWVMPEGYGSLLWCEAQPKKGLGTPEFTKVSVAVVDVGYENINMLMMDNFRLVKYVSTTKEFGMNKFYELVAAEIEGSDAQSLALIAAAHRPRGDRFYRTANTGKAVNLDDFLPNLTEMFSREISHHILAWLPERVTHVILTGGGGDFFWEDLQRLLKDVKVNAHLAAPSRQANVLGQYIYGEAHTRDKNKDGE